MPFIKKEEIEAVDFLSTSSDSGLSSNSRKRRRCSSGSDFETELNSTSTRTGRGIVIKPVDPATKCLTHATCRRVTDEIRVAINQKFAKMDYQEKRNFISTSVVCSLVNTERNGRYARKHSNEYHLYCADELGEFYDFTVCRAMFISTIGITPWTMRNWLGENLTLQGKEKVKKEPIARKSFKKVKKEEIMAEVKLEEQPCKKFKSMLLARYLKEINMA